MEEKRLGRLLAFMEERGWKYEFTEEDGLASIDFDYRGVPYHIWEFCEDGVYGAETNVRHGGRMEEIDGDYEEEIMNAMQGW